MDVRNDYPYSEIAQAVQANLALGNIKVQLMPSDNKQTLGRYRARQHDIYIGEWSADYIDPHSNAQGFAWNPDNSDKSSFKMLAWRNSWDIPELTKETQAALAESSTHKARADVPGDAEGDAREVAVRDHVPEGIAGGGAAGRDGARSRADQ